MRRPLDQVLADLRAIEDPYQRLGEADRLDAALAQARSAVAMIRSDTIDALRTPARGYGTIADRLGLTKSRVQQLARGAGATVPAAYAFQDQDGQWHGQPDLLPAGVYRDLRASDAFRPPSDPFNPFAGQYLIYRCGDLRPDQGVSLYALQILREDGSPTTVRMTENVGDALFGDPHVGSPAYVEFQAARERKRREIAGEK